MEIHLVDYSRTINIEARTMLEMVHKDIIPAVIKYSNELLNAISLKESIAFLNLKREAETKIVEMISRLLSDLYEVVTVLEENLDKAYHIENPIEQAESYCHDVFSQMVKMRQIVDKLEIHIPEELWAIPTYTNLLLDS